MPNIVYKKIRGLSFVVLLLLLSFQNKSQVSIGPYACCLSPGINSTYSFTASSPVYNGNTATINFTFVTLITTGCNPLAMNSTTFSFGDQTPDYVGNLVSFASISGGAAIASTFTASHTYTLPNVCAPAVYTLNLFTRSESMLLCNKDFIITVPHPGSTFSITKTYGNCNSVTFNALGTLPLLNAQWIYGNNVASSIMPSVSSTVYPYPAAGVYTAYLTGEGIAPCTVSTQVNVQGPVSDFTYLVLDQCSPAAGVALSIVNYSSTGVTYKFQINGGSLINISATNTTITSGFIGGINTIILIVSNGTCSSTITKTVNIGAPSNYNITATNSTCKTFNFNYTGSPALTNTQWAFGDGNLSPIITNGATNYIHTYVAPGNYVVSLSGVGISPCQLQTTVNVTEFTLADFTYTLNNLCDASAGCILGVSNYNSNYTYQWQINGFIVPSTGATGTYYTGLQNGNNVIKLTITNASNCSTSTTKVMSIGSPPASFSQYTNNVCLGDPLSIYNLSSGGGLYTWTITNSSGSTNFTGMNPAYTFTTIGSHAIGLTVTSTISANGQTAVCTSSYVTNTTVNSLPDATFSVSPLVCNNSLSLTLAAPSIPFTAYTLTYGDGTSFTGGSSFNPAHLTHTYATVSTNTIYTAQLTLFNGPCSSNYSQNIVINNNSSLILTSPDENFCAGSSSSINSTINSTVPGVGPFTYAWTGPGAFTSNTQNISVTVGGIYQLSATSTGTCPLVLSGSKSVTEVALPSVTVSGIAHITCINANGTVTLTLPNNSPQPGFLVNGQTATPVGAGLTYTYVLTSLTQGNNNIVITNPLNTSCATSTQVTITQTEPSINLTVTQPVNCTPGLGSANMSASPSGGTAYWYTTANYPSGSSNSGSSISNLAPGTYVLKYVDNNCVVISNFSIIKPAINLSKIGGVATCTNATTPLTINAQYIPQSLSSTYSYSIISATNTISGSTNQFSLSPGSYTALVTSAGGCSASLPFTIGQIDPLQVSLNTSEPSCKNVGNVSAIASGGNGNYTYEWFWNGSQNTNTTNVQTLSGIASTSTISVIVKDGSGCNTSGITYSVQVSPSSVVTLANCGGMGNTSATHTTPCYISTCLQGGTPNYLYEWFKITPTQETVQWNFSYNSSGTFVATSGTNVVIVPIPTSSTALNLSLNTDFSVTTVAYPYWNFTVSVAGPVPEMNSTGIAASVSNSTNSLHFYSVIEQVTFPTFKQFITSYSGPSGANGSIEKFKTGEYELNVTDALGCKYTFSIGTITITEPTTFKIAFDYVWGMGKKEIPEPVVDPILHENMVEAADELLDQASQCAIKKTKQLLSYLNQDCGNLNNIKDELTVSYQLNDHHYTLYYYDRAGRLTKTVPPQGVELVSQTDVTAIKTNRNGDSAPGGWPTLTAHRMATTYKYNSFGQLVSQTTPDGGTTNFIYDSKNRLRFSQNDHQMNTNSSYSYTKYDSLGRIVEVGQSELSGLNFANLTVVGNTTAADLLSFPQANVSGANNKQITTTVYSATSTANYYGKPQRYLQNRVSYSYIDENPLLPGDEHYTYYSYDSHGNVEWLIQDNPGGLGQNYIAYDYDLVSGKVMKVRYNEKRSDRFFHRYAYDSENRLVRTETSRNGELWDRDAQYSYYAHGPLKRNVLGEDHVQGLDYIYTVHGWIKAVNAPNLSPASDPGKDNDITASGAPQERTAADRFGMVLNYYSGDYTSYTNNFLKTTSQYSLAAYSATNGAAPSLYNGNISGWIQSQLDATATSTLAARADLFQYDVLNRIKQSTSVKEDATTSAWTTLGPGATTFKTEYTYDRNGNILNLKRNDDLAAAMDNLQYTYDNGSMGSAATKNRLTSVQDVIGTTVTGRQDFQNTHNYSYDAIGNLIKETGQEFMAVGTSTVQALRSFTTNITWTVYGKIKEIKKLTVGGSTNYKERITFQYDASGNRVKKDYWKDSYASPDGIEQSPEITTTFYVRDAQGNTMSTYKRYYDITNSVYKIDLTEQPIYGSDRVGQNTEIVTLASASNTTNLVLPGNGVTSISEYQNWITSAGKTSLLPITGAGNNDNLCQCKILELTNSGVNPNYNTVQTAVEILGIANNGVAVAEDLNRNLQFYVVLTKNYLGSKDACLVFDKDGKLMAGSDMIGAVDVNSKPVIVNLPNSNKYAIVTLNTSQQAMYHVVDMSLLGYGPVANSGSVISVDNLLDNTMSGGKTHNYHFTGVEDHITGHSIIYAGKFIQDPVNPGKGNTHIMAYDFGINVVSPTAFTVSSAYGCATTEQGQLQLSPDGKKIAWWRYDQYLAGFDYKTGEIRTYVLNGTRTGVVGSATLEAISAAGNHGNGMLDFMANSKDILYSQRGVYKDGSGTTKYDRNVWRYDPISLPSYVINPNVSPLISYLYGEIKRGVDGNYYIPNMGKASNSIHSFNGTSYNAYSYAVDTMYKLASSLPTQVYKVFDNNILIKDFIRTIGNKDYELKDHLGNVRVVISDAKIITDQDASSTVSSGDLFTPEVRSAMSFYPFGQKMPGTEFYTGSKPRYDFNGKETDQETGTQDYGMRIYDTRIGKFLSVDPLAKSYPFYTPYQFAGNKSIQCVDIDGLEDLNYIVLHISKNGTAFVRAEIAENTTSRSHNGVLSAHNLGSGKVETKTPSNLLNQVLGIDPDKPQRVNPNIKGGVGGTFTPENGASEYYLQVNQSDLNSTGVQIEQVTDEGNYTNQTDQGLRRKQFIFSVPPDPAPYVMTPLQNLAPPGTVLYNPNAFINTVTSQVNSAIAASQQSNDQITNLTINYPNFPEYEAAAQDLSSKYKKQYPNATINLQSIDIKTTGGNSAIGVEVTGSPEQKLKQ